MCNVSSEAAGVGAGVLLRALEPVEGIALMEARRGTTKRLDLARGPGRLAAALAIDRGLDGIDLCAPGRLWLGAASERPAKPGPIGRSPRIGITREVDRPWRFYERGSPFVSGPGDCAYNLARRVNGPAPIPPRFITKNLYAPAD